MNDDNDHTLRLMNLVYFAFTISGSFKLAGFQLNKFKTIKRLRSALGDALRRMPQREQRMNERAERMLKGKGSRCLQETMASSSSDTDSDTN